MPGAPFDKSGWMPLVTFAYEAITVDNTSGGVTLSAATYDPAGGNGPAKAATIIVETASLRHRCIGAPTTTAGMLRDAGAEFIVWGSEDIKAIHFIRTGGSSATIHVEYSR